MAIASEVEQHETVIIGAGFSGLGMAIKLKEAGRTDFVVVDRGAEVGGTWYQNTYPGCACDVPSRLYSFSFAQNPGWSRAYSEQPEIFAYLRGLADRYALRPFLRLNTEFIGASWDEGEGRWDIRLGGGRRMQARFLICAVGGLSRPALPSLPGLEKFEGKTFHSQQWDHSYPLEGKKVAVIGTGASAIQFVPQIAPKVGHLDLFQRTPPWIMPRPDRPIGQTEQKVFRAVPLLQTLARIFLYWLLECRLIAFAFYPRLLKLAQREALGHLAAQVPDPRLREVLTPGYTMGCKRVLISNDYFPALTRPNVEVVTSGIAEVKANSIVTTDGVEHPADCIIFGTGFRATDPFGGIDVRGHGGRSLADAWKNGMEAYLGTTVAGFANLFILTGPNTGIGHTSLLVMIESQLAYVLDALGTISERGLRTVEVKPEVQRAFVADLDDRSRRTVWESGCMSWYLDQAGRNRTVWPDFTFKFRLKTRRFDVERYLCQPLPVGQTEAPRLEARAA
jgi:cation diffusion facilitator CzcD-associated flavoprotein CzcO